MNFRQRAALRVRSARTALRFVESVGLCSTFYVFPEGLPSLWEAVVGRPRPRWPRRSHHDAGIGLTWELKDVLPSRRQVYYGKLVKGRPALVALDVLAAFYALVRGSQRARDYAREYEAGRLSQSAKRLLDTLMRESPQYTRGLDRLVGRYLRAAVYSTPAVLSRLFAVTRSEVEATVGRLQRSGRVTAGVEITGQPGRFVVSA